MRQIETLDRLIEISLTLNSSQELEAILEFILTTAKELLHCEATSLMLYDERDQQLYFTASIGANSMELEQMAVPLEGSIAGTVFSENCPMVVNDTATEPRHFKLIERQIGYQVRNLLGVPMRIQDRNIGVLEAVNKHEGAFGEEDVQLLSFVGAQSAIAIHNAQIVEKLQAANQELRHADQLKVDFMAVASHELRTPLGIILGYATFLKEEGQGEFSEHADTVLNAALRLRTLLEDMTNMNLLYSGATELRLRITTIQAILRQAFDEVYEMARAQNMLMDIQYPKQDIWIEADERLLKVFVNLLNNAIRFTPANGEIFIQISTGGTEVLVEVRDTGIGISQEKLERIFEYFYQVEHHMTRRYDGLGLGLAIARGMVELHGGRIWAESEGPGRGATFKVALPTVPPPE